MILARHKKKLQQWKSWSLTRKLHKIERQDKNTVNVNLHSAVNFCSNDYLGLSKHTKIIEVFKSGIQKYGLGSGASALISGYTGAHAEFETEFARWLGVDKAILFSSGYLANIGTITALADRDCTILSDKSCHASILDGIQLSRAKHCRYKNNSLTDFERLMNLKKPDLIVTESIFSMSGNISPVSKISSLVNQESLFIVDDAHGVGVLGERGKGICECENINPDKIDCLIAPLGKAFNAMGAIVAGKSEIIETILQFARTYRYTTALPPAIAHTLLETLRIVNDESWRRESLLELEEFFITEALSRKLCLSSLEKTPIKSIVIQDNKKTLSIQDDLLRRGFFVSCIRPPTVPNNQACIRISLSCLHAKSEIIQLLDLIRDFNE